MDVLSLSKIRVQVLQQVFPSGEEPIDIVFCMIGDNLTGENGAFPPTRDGCIHSLSMRERG